MVRFVAVAVGPSHPQQPACGARVAAQRSRRAADIDVVAAGAPERRLGGALEPPGRMEALSHRPAGPAECAS